MSRALVILVLVVALPGLLGADDCSGGQPSSDKIQSEQQERILQEGTSAVGMPAIKNFREKRLLKDILELRDQQGLVTTTYVWSEMNAKLVFLCDSIGYGIPYATQFTNPQKLLSPGAAHEYVALAQADPNGLFSPASADGTWVMCKSPHGSSVRPVYIEPRIVVSPFPLVER